MRDLQALSENCVRLTLGEDIDPAVLARVQAATALVRHTLGSAVQDLVPSYASLLITLNLRQLDAFAACRLLAEPLAALDASEPPAGRRHSIPVCYHADVAPDLLEVARRTGLSPDEVVALHSQTEYRCYAIGFMPGFAFLGALDERLALPRRDAPRPEVPAGSLAIAHRQTAVYPRATPGGWHLIGRSPVDMLSLCQQVDAPLQVGDIVQFRPLSRTEFLAQGGQL